MKANIRLNSITKKACNVEMKKFHAVIVSTIFSLFLILPSEAAPSGGARRLQFRYYRRKCPQAELVVAQAVAAAFVKDPTVAASFIRILFHDCFVTGCDASVLLDYSHSGEPVEKTSPANGKGLKGLDLIDEIKARLEKECPETVSCADIVAFAAREAVFLSGLPRHPVQAGRRDGRTSRVSDVFKNIPFPTMSVDDLIALYARKGLTAEDLVVLAGAHSIGSAHCKMFDHRLYLNFTETDIPPMEPGYAALLRRQCPPPNLGNVEERDSAVVNFDPHTPLRLDTMFYVNLLRGRGLLQSDQVLVSDPRTSRLVSSMAFNPGVWGRKFILAMEKMGKIDVLTRRKGEIRKNCRVPN